MTRKDFELIAEAVAAVEADYKGMYENVLREVAEELAVRLRGDNPRFDRGRFMAAALPLRAERLRDEYENRVESDRRQAMVGY